MNYLIASHVAYNHKGQDTFGPAHSVYEYLTNHNIDVSFVKHSLEGNFNSKYIRDGKTSEIGRFQRSRLILRTIEQIALNIKLVNSYKSKVYYVGADPINAISGVLLKSMNKSHKYVYFTMDYADRRFNNTLLNLIYHWMDKIAVKSADEVWCVSSRIYNKRISQGIVKSKLRFIPNSPIFDQIPKKPYDGNLDLVIVSHISSSLNLKPILDILSDLSAKYPKLRLKIVGSGPKEKKFRNYVAKKSYKNKVIFMGQMEHLEAINVIADSFLGIAIYTNENPWNWYGDSMKAREYVACGVPVIINEIPSTADDVKKFNAGLVAKDINSIEISEFIEKCINEKEFYTKLRLNALQMAKRFDKNRVFHKTFGF